MIKIDKGLIIILCDGTIVNFPEGNTNEYRAWAKTDEGHNALLMFADKRTFINYETEHATKQSVTPP